MREINTTIGLDQLMKFLEYFGLRHDQSMMGESISFIRTLIHVMSEGKCLATLLVFEEAFCIYG